MATLAAMIYAPPPAQLLDLAHGVAACAIVRQVEVDPRQVTLIDYSLPSTAPRLWVIDLQTDAVVYQSRVAHGRNSGEDVAISFSNRSGSLQTSLGVFRTAETYQGEHGLSLRLDGLEPGFNDAARARSIVIHGADYVSDRFVAEHGRAGRSWGCPALPQGVVTEIVPAIAGGQLLVAWYPDATWLGASLFLHCG